MVSPRLRLPLVLGASALAAAVTVPTDVQMPGTQPHEVRALQHPDQCDNCHGNYAPDHEPYRTWNGSMMAHAGRDPLFWASFAIAEQDFDGSGDLCLRCHTPAGWYEGASTPTEGINLTSDHAWGVECALCHRMADTDGQEHAGVQNPPFVAHDGGSNPEGWYGSGMLALIDSNDRLGPYANVNANHSALQSEFHRSSDLCGSCHDVSNPLVGDLAHNNGAQTPLPPGSFSGVPGSPVSGKAAFNNPPYAYGVVERTFSEHQASSFAGYPVSAYANLPSELQQGVVEDAYQAALIAGRGGDFEDGTTRTFTCQTCHMQPVQGKGADRNNAPVRNDLAVHDLTGGSTWVQDAIVWLDNRSRLRLGGGLTQDDRDAMTEGKARARDLLRGSAELAVQGDVLRVTNLSGHKLISGYPEGRRMWIQVRWLDSGGGVIREDGAYGDLAVQHRGQPMVVRTLLNPGDPRTHVYEAKMGITQQWANQLLGLGLDPNLVLEYDRGNGAPGLTLGQLAAQPAGSDLETFHFVLNNTIVKDDRIPPWGLAYDAALARNVLPVPETQYGDPGPGGVYRHWDEILLEPPAGAVRGEIRLLYQSTSWEYVQFLDLANDGSQAGLATVGADLLEAWMATGMAEPEVMATAAWTLPERPKYRVR